MIAWDDGVRWHLEQLEAVDFELDPLTLAFVRDSHLRVTSGTVENDYITSLMKTSFRRAERVTQRSLIPQQKALVLDRFPCWAIELPQPPCVSVESITYLDEDGAEQTLSGSPAEYDVSLPSGPTAGRARITPLYGMSWPAARCQPDAVTVTFTAGYPLAGSREVADIPEDITHGRLLMIAELYRQRSESVREPNQTPAMIRARELWLAYKAY